MTNQPETVRVKDMYAVAYLIAAGIQPVGTQADGRVVWFSFPNSPDTQERLLGFNINLQVGIQDFVTALRRTRDLIFYAKGGQR
jgi:Domain of unknown function (DUF5659)